MKNILFVLSIITIGITTSNCSQPKLETNSQTIVEVEANQKQGLNAVLWHQTAGEYKALCYQSYNLARMQLDHKLQNHAFPYNLPPAIVMDLDETVVNNSFFNAQLIKDNTTFSKEEWKRWSDKIQATAVPGAIEFIQYARSKGVDIFFVSNRREIELKNTKLNLEALGLTKLDTNFFFFRTDESSKLARRNEVSKTHEIIMLFGDNLADFTELFDKKTTMVRNDLVDSLQNEFGSSFIVLPNVLYGEWEGSLFDYKYDWSESQKDSIRMEMIKGF